VEAVRLITEFKKIKTAQFSTSISFFWSQFWTLKSLVFGWIVWAFFTTLSTLIDMQQFTFFVGFTFILGYVFYKFQGKNGRFLLKEMNKYYVLLLVMLIGIDVLISKVEVIDEIIVLTWMVYLSMIRNYILTFNYLKKQIYACEIS
jgi:hypothetical protein